jgi:hypothetical protein
MSEAIALEATERIRDLIAKPEAWGLTREDVAGIEPLDVACKFNRAASHTSSAFQVHATFAVSLDNGATYRRMTALVAEGKTKAQCLEVLYNWLADPHRLAMAREVLGAYDKSQLDVLAQAEMAKAKALTDKQARGAEAMQQNWAERKLDQLARKMGIKDKKVQV